ncbi:MAG: hypothetical protein KGL90_00390 [Burkholderiales bacterium]|nr:hypothetical protein [Burkholderiales bacterium]
MNAKANEASAGDVLLDASTVDRAAQSAHDAIDRMAAKAGPAVERVRAAASEAAETLQDKADALGDLEEQWLDSVRGFVREKPLTAVAMGLLAGLLLSRLTR